MKTKLSTVLGEIQEKLKSGLPVPVQFFDMESSYIEEFDDSFVAFVTNIEVGDDHISIFLEWSQFTEHNKRIDKCRYYDDKGQPTLSFFDSKFYPKNHKTDFYIDEQEAFEHIAILEDVTPFLNPPKVPISKEDLLALLKENLTIKLNVECKQDNAYMRELEILGYSEMFRTKDKNKMIGSRRLDELPEGRKLSVYGEVEVTFPKGTVLRLRKSVNEYEWKSQGQILISTILPINGRLI